MGTVQLFNALEKVNIAEKKDRKIKADDELAQE
jgi:hypothetical protein